MTPGRSSSRATHTRRMPSATAEAGSEPRTLLEYGDAQASDRGLSELARTFDGAWPYLQLIAAANRIDSASTPESWTRTGSATGCWTTSARAPSRDTSRTGSAAVSDGAGRTSSTRSQRRRPHHCSTSSRLPVARPHATGIVDEPLCVLDQCRTTPGRVLAVDGDRAEVSHPFSPGAGASFDGPVVAREVRRRADGLAFAETLQSGDWVSLHWDFVCERMTSSRARRLLDATVQALNAVNRAAGGLPAGAG